MNEQIDQKVVSMRFENKNFDKNVRSSEKTLDDLKSKLNIKEAANSFNGSLEAIAAKMTIVTNVTSKLYDGLVSVIKSLSIDNISAGWRKYETETKSVATIVNNAEVEADKVYKILGKLQTFTDETSYSYEAMINTIGKFVSSGVELDTAVVAMEGISTWAASAGKGVNEAAIVMNNLAQAIGTGTVKLQDWMSIENATMATKQFKEELIKAGVETGRLGKEASSGEIYAGAEHYRISAENIRDSLKYGWLDTETLMKVLEKYGKFSDELMTDIETFDEYDLYASKWLDNIKEYKNETSSAILSTEEKEKKAFEQAAKMMEISSSEYNMHKETIEKVAKELIKFSEDEYDFGVNAFEAAQKARTLSDAVNAVKDAVSTGWSKTFKYLFGEFEDATNLWTGLSESLYDTFTKSASNRNSALRDWFNTYIDEEGRTLKKVIKQQEDGTTVIEYWWEEIKENIDGTSESILHQVEDAKIAYGYQKKTVQALSSIFNTFLSIINQVRDGIYEVLGLKTEGIVRLSDILIKKADEIKKAFHLEGDEKSILGDEVYDSTSENMENLEKIGEHLGNIVKNILSILKKLGQFIKSLFKILFPDFENTTSFLEFVLAKIEDITGLLNNNEFIQTMFSGLGNSIKWITKTLISFFKSAYSWVKDNLLPIFKEFGSSFKTAFEGFDFDSFNSFFDALANVFKSITGTGFAAEGAEKSTGLIQKILEGIANFFNIISIALVEIPVETIKALTTALATVVLAVLNLIASLIIKIGEVFKEIGNNEKLSNFFNILGDAFYNILLILAGIVQTVAKWIADLDEGKINEIIDKIDAWFKKVGAWFKGFWSGLVAFYETQKPMTDFVNKILIGIGNAFIKVFKRTEEESEAAGRGVAIVIVVLTFLVVSLFVLAKILRNMLRPLDSIRRYIVSLSRAYNSQWFFTWLEEFGAVFLMIAAAITLLSFVDFSDKNAKIALAIVGVVFTTIVGLLVLVSIAQKKMIEEGKGDIETSIWDELTNVWRLLLAISLAMAFIISGLKKVISASGGDYKVILAAGGTVSLILSILVFLILRLMKSLRDSEKAFSQLNVSDDYDFKFKQRAFFLALTLIAFGAAMKMIAKAISTVVRSYSEGVNNGLRTRDLIVISSAFVLLVAVASIFTHSLEKLKKAQTTWPSVIRRITTIASLGASIATVIIAIGICYSIIANSISKLSSMTESQMNSLQSSKILNTILVSVLGILVGVTVMASIILIMADTITKDFKGNITTKQYALSNITRLVGVIGLLIVTLSISLSVFMSSVISILPYYEKFGSMKPILESFGIVSVAFIMLSNVLVGLVAGLMTLIKVLQKSNFFGYGDLKGVSKTILSISSSLLLIGLTIIPLIYSISIILNSFRDQNGNLDINAMKTLMPSIIGYIAIIMAFVAVIGGCVSALTAIISNAPTGSALTSAKIVGNFMLFALAFSVSISLILASVALILSVVPITIPDKSLNLVDRLLIFVGNAVGLLVTAIGFLSRSAKDFNVKSMGGALLVLIALSGIISLLIFAVKSFIVSISQLDLTDNQFNAVWAAFGLITILLITIIMSVGVLANKVIGLKNLQTLMVVGNYLAGVGILLLGVTYGVRILIKSVIEFSDYVSSENASSLGRIFTIMGVMLLVIALGVGLVIKAIQKIDIQGQVNLKTFMSKFLPFMLILGSIVGIIYVTLNALDFGEMEDEVLNSMRSIFIASNAIIMISVAFAIIMNALKNVENVLSMKYVISLTTAFISFGILCVTVGATLLIINGVDWKSGLIAIGTFLSVALVMSLSIKYLEKFSEDSKGSLSKLAYLLGVFAALAGVLVAMAYALKIAEGVNILTSIVVIIAFSRFLAACVGIFAIINSIKLKDDILKRIGMISLLITSISLSMLLVSLSLSNISGKEFKKAWTLLLSFATVIASVVTLIKMLKKIEDPSTMKKIGEISAIILAISSAIYLLSLASKNFESFGKAFGSVMEYFSENYRMLWKGLGAFAGIITVLALLSPFAIIVSAAFTSISLTILSISLSILVFVSALKKLLEIEPKRITEFLDELPNMLKSFRKSLSKVSGEIALIAGMIFGILITALVSQVPNFVSGLLDTLVRVIDELTLRIADIVNSVLVLVGEILKGVASGIGALTEPIILVLQSIVDMFVDVLDKIDWSNAGKSFLGFIASLAVFTEATVIFIAAVSALGIALIAAKLYNSTVKNMSEAVQAVNGMPDISDTALSIMNTMIGMFEAFSKLTTLSGAIMALSPISGVMSTIISSLFSAITTVITTKNFKNIIEEIATGAKDIFNALGELDSNSIDTSLKAIDGMVSIISAIGEAKNINLNIGPSIKGISKGLTALAKSFRKITKLFNKKKNPIDIHEIEKFATCIELLSKAGKNVDNGGIQSWIKGKTDWKYFGTGIEKAAESVVNAASILTNGTDGSAPLTAAAASTFDRFCTVISDVAVSGKNIDNGGMQSWIKGKTDWDHFAEGIEMVANGVSSCASVLVQNKDNIENAPFGAFSDIVNSFSDLGDRMGIVIKLFGLDFWSKTPDYESFSNGIKDLIVNLAAVSMALSGKDVKELNGIKMTDKEWDSMTKIVGILERLVGVAKQINDLDFKSISKYTPFDTTAPAENYVTGFDEFAHDIAILVQDVLVVLSGVEQNQISKGINNLSFLIDSIYTMLLMTKSFEKDATASFGDPMQLKANTAIPVFNAIMSNVVNFALEFADKIKNLDTKKISQKLQDLRSSLIEFNKPIVYDENNYISSGFIEELIDHLQSLFDETEIVIKPVFDFSDFDTKIASRNLQQMNMSRQYTYAAAVSAKKAVEGYGDTYNTYNDNSVTNYNINCTGSNNRELAENIAKVIANTNNSVTKNSFQGFANNSGFDKLNKVSSAAITRDILHGKVQQYSK